LDFLSFGNSQGNNFSIPAMQQNRYLLAPEKSRPINLFRTFSQ